MTKIRDKCDGGGGDDASPSIPPLLGDHGCGWGVAGAAHNTYFHVLCCNSVHMGMLHRVGADCATAIQLEVIIRRTTTGTKALGLIDRQT